MKNLVYSVLCSVMLCALPSCMTKSGATHMNGLVGMDPTFVSYNELTMDLDTEPIEYVIDISTEAGRAKLNNLSLDEAKELALVEAIIKAKCATIFQAQYTHVVNSGRVLGIKIYGFPARYKKTGNN